jgi:hypothetical protein
MANEKPFDAVQTMREIRDRISREIAGMTFDEEKRWMQEKLARHDRSPAPPPVPSSDKRE